MITTVLFFQTYFQLLIPEFDLQWPSLFNPFVPNAPEKRCIGNKWVKAILIMLLSRFPLTFLLAQKSMCFFKKIQFSRLSESVIFISCSKDIGERATANTYCPVSLSSIVRKIFEKVLNNKLVDCIRKFDFLSDFQYQHAGPLYKLAEFQFRFSTLYLDFTVIASCGSGWVLGLFKDLLFF